jgi:CRP/FNR family transcriptional regulator, cyclic AMP receptor protein
METLEPLLSKHPFFEGLEPNHLKTLTGCASNVHFPGGQMIFKEGEEANQFFLLREGRVAIEVFVEARGPVTIQTLSAGEILGWSWLVPPYYWRFDARAVDEVRALALDGKCLREKCETDPRLGYELLKRFAVIISRRLEATRIQLLDVYGRK